MKREPTIGVQQQQQMRQIIVLEKKTGQDGIQSSGSSGNQNRCLTYSESKNGYTNYKNYSRNGLDIPANSSAMPDVYGTHN